MEVAVLGLGEAGGRIAADLVTAGCAVRGFDPCNGRPGSSMRSALDAVGGRRRRSQRQRCSRRARDRRPRVAGCARLRRALRRPEHLVAGIEA